MNAVMVGTGEYAYEALRAWQQLPAGVSLVETPGVAVGARDRVYALTRNPAHPVIVFEPEGTFVASFGQGVFSDRTHGILVGPTSRRRAGVANPSTVRPTPRFRT